ncbi:MAG: hypothetical protein H0V96_03370 [Acidimicrobiia bacterium]|nr:hypothetical protein [Acidimicrobiia bacterium]
MVNRTVVVLANDVTPGLGLPTAAPGLRAFGLAEGLAAHGCDVVTVVPKPLLDQLWTNPALPPPLRPGVIAMAPQELAPYLATREPATVVMTNSNQVKNLRRSPGLRYVFDFFAPKMLELAYQYGEDHPHQQLLQLRERKIAALELADAIAINGAKKLGYVLAWVLQTSHDARRLPIDVVNMAVPGVERNGRGDGPLRFAIAGYLQGWSIPGRWLKVVGDHIAANADTRLDILLETHWGQTRGRFAVPLIDELLALPNVTSQPVMRFAEFQTFMAGVDVALDLFSRSLEREYAMVTRTVVALACGVPVIHPPFTEVAPLIEAYDAGWLHAAEDVASLPQLLGSITPQRAAEKAGNARRLWREVFEPRRATEPLVSLIDAAWSRS